MPEDTDLEKEAIKAAPAAALPAGGDIKGVPGFWLQALKNYAYLQELAENWCSIQERDEGALAYLVDVRCSRDDDKCHVLEFEFRENPYFTNKVLTKSYFMSDDDMGLGESNFSRAEGTTIEWKPKQDLTQKMVQKKVKNRRKGGHTIQTVAESCESFFQYFATLQMPEDEELDEEEVPALLSLPLRLLDGLMHLFLTYIA